MSRQDDYDEELREHIEIETRENIERGMPLEQARRAALRTFGNVGVVRQRLREGGPLHWLATFLQDVRYGLRLLKRSPLLAAAIVITLTLGIGINTGVFTVLNGVMVRARNDSDPGHFAHVTAEYSGGLGAGLPWGFSTADFGVYSARVRSMENVAGWGIVQATFGDKGADELVMPVTCNFFSLYGLDRPKMGRLFRPDECAHPGTAPVVVISEELWRGSLRWDPLILGSAIELNHQPFVVVGVAPARFSGSLRGPGIWVPYTMQPMFSGGRDYFRDRSTPWLTLEGHLRPGETRGSAQAELAVIARQQDRLQPDRKTTLYVTDGSLIQEPGLRGQIYWVTPLLFGALTLILLLACTNVTMLLLSRASARQREIAIRLSLGAGRSRLLRMLLTESLILAGVAGAISAWLAGKVPAAAEALLPNMPHYPLDPDSRVLAYLAAITLFAGIIAGIAPASESLRVDLTASLKNHEGLAGAGRVRAHAFLMGAQVAMSFVLLAGAGLFVRAGFGAFRESPGFEARQVLIFSARAPMPPYTASSASVLARTLEQRMRALPGARFVSFASAPPFAAGEGSGPSEEVLLHGQEKGTGLTVAVNTVSPEYFATLSIPIVLGRSFRQGEAPRRNALSPALISEAFARELWPGQDPMGRRFSGATGDALEVVGVARDVKSLRFGELDGPVLYRLRDPQSAGSSILVRFNGDAAPMVPTVRALARSVDREMLPSVQTLESAMDSFQAAFWKLTKMVLFLAVVAVVLAVVGIYGVASFAVTRRTREIGIRMALGATQTRIVGSVMASGVRPVVTGLLFGSVLVAMGAAALQQVLRATPVGLNVADPVAYVSVAALLVSTAFTAMFVPALRAARLAPSSALRQD